MENKNIEYLIHRILSGKNIFSYNNSRYELHKPSLELKLRSDLIYQEAYDNNLYNNFWLLEDIPNLAIEIGLLNYSYKEQLQQTEKRLDNAKLELFKEYFDFKKRQKNRLNISRVKKEHTNLYASIHYLDYLSLEHFCEKIKNEFLISKTLYFSHNLELVFGDNIEYLLFNNIMTEISSHIIQIEAYKEIARHEYWKNLWSNNRFKILDEPVNQWSDEQKTLFNISFMYEKIYEHPECPVDEIINDDDALDGWMIHQKRENLKQKQEKGVDNILSDKVKNSAEVFLMAPSNDQAQSITELNSEQSLRIMKQKIDFVKSQEGPVKEVQLPDVKQRIIEQIKGK